MVDIAKKVKKYSLSFLITIKPNRPKGGFQATAKINFMAESRYTLMPFRFGTFRKQDYSPLRPIFPFRALFLCIARENMLFWALVNLKKNR